MPLFSSQPLLSTLKWRLRICEKKSHHYNLGQLCKIAQAAIVIQEMRLEFTRRFMGYLYYHLLITTDLHPGYFSYMIVKEF